MKKVLVGGQALKLMGSTRHTNDSDYLVFNPALPMFSKDDDGNDLLNAAKSRFFLEIWKTESEREQTAFTHGMASPQALLELKAYALVQHCQNGHFQKADDCEFDIRFLVRAGAGEMRIANKYMTTGQAQEISAIINNVKS